MVDVPSEFDVVLTLGLLPSAMWQPFWKQSTSVLGSRSSDADSSVVMHQLICVWCAQVGEALLVAVRAASRFFIPDLEDG